MIKFIYPNSAIIRFITLILALAISGIILALPSAISNLGENYHNYLNLIMLVLISAYVYGFGFKFKFIMWQLLFSPIISNVLMIFILFKIV
jgi:predicted membrane protein